MKNMNNDKKELKNSWNEKNKAAFFHEMEKSETTETNLIKAQESFRKAVLNAVNEGVLDESLNQVFLKNNGESEKEPEDASQSFFIYDTLQEVAVLPSDMNKTTELKATAVTATVRELINLSRMGQELAETLKETKVKGDGGIKDEGEEFFCLGMFPAHILTSFSPQSVAHMTEIGKVAQTDMDKAVQGLREHLVPYSIFTQIKTEEPTVMDTVTTGVLLMLIKTDEKGTLDNSAMMKATKSWAEANDIQALFSPYLSWPKAIVEAFLQQSFFSWGATARENGIYESVLSIDSVNIDRLKKDNEAGDNVILTSYIDEEVYGESELDGSVAKWPLDLLVNTLEERGINIT